MNILAILVGILLCIGGLVGITRPHQFTNESISKLSTPMRVRLAAGVTLLFGVIVAVQAIT